MKNLEILNKILSDYSNPPNSIIDHDLITTLHDQYRFGSLFVVINNESDNVQLIESVLINAINCLDNLTNKSDYASGEGIIWRHVVVACFIKDLLNSIHMAGVNGLEKFLILFFKSMSKIRVLDTDIQISISYNVISSLMMDEAKHPILIELSKDLGRISRTSVLTTFVICLTNNRKNLSQQDFDKVRAVASIFVNTDDAYQCQILFSYVIEKLNSDSHKKAVQAYGSSYIDYVIHNPYDANVNDSNSYINDVVIIAGYQDFEKVNFQAAFIIDLFSEIYKDRYHFFVNKSSIANLVKYISIENLNKYIVENYYLQANSDSVITGLIYAGRVDVAFLFYCKLRKKIGIKLDANFLIRSLISFVGMKEILAVRLNIFFKVLFNDLKSQSVQATVMNDLRIYLSKNFIPFESFIPLESNVRQNIIFNINKAIPSFYLNPFNKLIFNVSSSLLRKSKNSNINFEKFISNFRTNYLTTSFVFISFLRHNITETYLKSYLQTHKIWTNNKNSSYFNTTKSMLLYTEEWKCISNYRNLCIAINSGDEVIIKDLFNRDKIPYRFYEDHMDLFPKSLKGDIKKRLEFVKSENVALQYITEAKKDQTWIELSFS